MESFGVSFSVKYANELKIDPKACLEASLKELHVKRLRLMSYWDIHEPNAGEYNFNELDWQFKLAKGYGAKISLAIGLRQPRWPESHWPSWAEGLPKRVWQAALFDFIEATIKRYKDHPNLESWQLENEALLKTFGEKGNFDRHRLVKEFNLVKLLDPTHPIIMTCSDSWGIPLRHPKPDVYGISVYRRFYDRGVYRRSRRPAYFYTIRGLVIKLFTGKSVFIHELQTEPWGPRATKDLDLAEQALTMNPIYFKETIQYAQRTELLPTYLWGLEWWYWLMAFHNDRMWQAAKEVFLSSVL